MARNGARYMYSRRRNAMAPSCIMPWISCIFSLPAGCRRTYTYVAQAITRPTTPATMADVGKKAYSLTLSILVD